MQLVVESNFLFFLTLNHTDEAQFRATERFVYRLNSTDQWRAQYFGRINLLKTAGHENAWKNLQIDKMAVQQCSPSHHNLLCAALNMNR